MTENMVLYVTLDFVHQSAWHKCRYWSTPFYCTSKILHLLQIGGLCNPDGAVGTISNSICSLHASLSHFG